MKIKNVSAKVIGVLGKVLLPDEVYDCNENVVANESVDALIKLGFLQMDDSAEKEAAIKEQALKEAREQLLKEMAENGEEKPKARRGRKPAQPVESEDAVE